MASDDRSIDNGSPDDWARDVRYATLIAVPDVRANIANCALRSRPGVSAEQCLAFFDVVSPTVAGALTAGVAPTLSALSLSKLSNVLVPIFVGLGIRASHTRSADLPIPPGLVIAATLCSFARTGKRCRAHSNTTMGVSFRQRCRPSCARGLESCMLGSALWRTT